MNRMAEGFLDQNEYCATTLTAEQVEPYAEYHAGGLIVLLRHLDDGLFVKMHDSWGGGDEIVVHQYDPDADEDTDTVWEFTDATEALTKFQEL